MATRDHTADGDEITPAPRTLTSHGVELGDAGATALALFSGTKRVCGVLMGSEFLAQGVKGPIRQAGIVQLLDIRIQRSREVASHNLAHLILP
jgi:hypothetical protein